MPPALIVKMFNLSSFCPELILHITYGDYYVMGEIYSPKYFCNAKAAWLAWRNIYPVKNCIIYSNTSVEPSFLVLLSVLSQKSSARV